jgi:hypothetical protein
VREVEMCPTACMLLQHVAVGWLVFSSRASVVKIFTTTKAAMIPPQEVLTYEYRLRLL